MESENGQGLPEEAVSAPEMERPVEKTLTQSEVNAIVKREKQKAAESARREAQAELERLQSQSMGGVESQGANVDEQLKKLVENQFQQMQDQQEQQRREEEANQLAQTYYSKLAQGRELHADFDDVISDFDVGAFPQVAVLATQLDNTGSIMYELAKNPSKLAQVAVLAERYPEGARKMLQGLGNSVVKNQEAIAGNVATNEPLSRLKPSMNAGMDDGKLTVADYKKQPWLRG